MSKEPSIRISLRVPVAMYKKLILKAASTGEYGVKYCVLIREWIEKECKK